MMDGKNTGTDERFYTPRSSARRGYSSGSEDERFASPRESARSISSDENEYMTPREASLPLGDSIGAYADEYQSYRAVAKHIPTSQRQQHYVYKQQLQRNNSYLEQAGLRSQRSGPVQVRSAQYVDAAAPSAPPENDIFSAARHNRIDSVTYMLDQGVAVNSKDAHGNTILSIACQNGLKRMAKLALRRGANINSQNLRGNTALHFCFAYGYGDTLASNKKEEEQRRGKMVCERLGFSHGGMATESDHVTVGAADGEEERVDDWQRRRDALMRMRGGNDDEEVHSDDTDLEEVDQEWRQQLHEGDPVDAQNLFGNWCPAMIIRIADGEAQIKYLNMNDRWQRWLPLDSGQLAPPATKSRNDNPALRLAQHIEVRKSPRDALWKEALVVRTRPMDVLVRYAGRHQQFDEWIPFMPETIAPAGDHLSIARHHRTTLQHRQQRVDNNALTTPRQRVIQAQNPRFMHYREALLGVQGLQIHVIEGDGNCLFRAVSHQIYGDDRHYALVRATCMDYMESEKEYFEPYVVGDMAAFMRYLAHKRRDGVWGDDPELQALCELYDRPAEVYAYDPTHGFRKLRTFHENSGVSRNRPPICLSYYGGGHYDSLVGPSHGANLIREAPGDWERRHIGYSHRINTRESSGDDATTEGITRQVQSETDRERTEMEQLEHILMVSRNEFDAMDSSLEDTLKLSLAEVEGDEPPHAAAQLEHQDLDEATRESEMAAIQAELIAKAKEASEEEQMKQAIQASLVEGGSGAVSDADFNDQVSAAIQASLGQAHGGYGASAEDEYEEHMRRVMELSAQEYASGSDERNHPSVFGFPESDATNADELDELQRAIQASLEQP